MRQHHFIPIIFSFLFVYKGNCNTTNYYIELNKNTIEIGEYEGVKFNRKKIYKSQKEQLDFKYIDSLFNHNSNLKTLLYFHGINYHDRYSQKYTLKRLRKLTSPQQTISIIWKPQRITYKGCWKKSIHQGEEIKELMNQITSHSKNKYYVLCHSMGHRLLEGIIKDKSQNKVKYEAVIFAAPDLDIDVFQNSLSRLPEMSNSIIIYSNEKDIMLRMSKRIHKRERLGLNIIEHKKELDTIPNVEIINVTHSKLGKPDRFTKHSYWMRNKSVLQDIDFIIGSENDKRSIHLIKKKNNYYELK